MDDLDDLNDLDDLDDITMRENRDIVLRSCEKRCKMAGYAIDYSKSNNAIAAEDSGLVVASVLAKRAARRWPRLRGLTAADIAAVVSGPRPMWRRSAPTQRLRAASAARSAPSETSASGAASRLQRRIESPGRKRWSPRFGVYSLGSFTMVALRIDGRLS